MVITIMVITIMVIIIIVISIVIIIIVIITVNIIVIIIVMISDFVIVIIMAPSAPSLVSSGQVDSCTTTRTQRHPRQCFPSRSPVWRRLGSGCRASSAKVSGIVVLRSDLIPSEGKFPDAAFALSCLVRMVGVGSGTLGSGGIICSVIIVTTGTRRVMMLAIMMATMMMTTTTMMITASMMMNMVMTLVIYDTSVDLIMLMAVAVAVAVVSCWRACLSYHGASRPRSTEARRCTLPASSAQASKPRC